MFESAPDWRCEELERKSERPYVDAISVGLTLPSDTSIIWRFVIERAAEPESLLGPIDCSTRLLEHSAFVFDNRSTRAHNLMADGSLLCGDSSISAAHSIESAISERCDSFD